MRILAAQINPIVGDVEGNTQKVLAALDRGREKKIDLILFPELTLSGYFPDDLLLDASFIDAISTKLEVLEPATHGLFAVIGLPRWNPSRKEKPLYNSAAIFADGKLLGFKNKTLLPTYDVFDERRYFQPGTDQPVWNYLGRRIAVTICEDLWQHAGLCGDTHYARDPVEELKEQRPDLLLNISGSPYSYKRLDTRLNVFGGAAKALSCPVVFCNQVGANDQLVFDGYSFYLNEKGEAIQIAKGFVEDDLVIDLDTHACPCPMPERGTRDLYAALVLGVKDYFHKQGFQKAVLGLSGGIDSALVACIAKDALGEKNVLAITLPARFSSEGSVSDSVALAKNLGIEIREIPFDALFQKTLDLLEPAFGELLDQTEQNLQSRLRGLILMALSNQSGALLLNTGNKSEMALGYTTLYGDMAGALGVLQDVTKLRVYELAHYVNQKEPVIPSAILTKTPSAELKPNQTDFDTLPPYEVLDPILEDYMERNLSPEEIATKRGLALSFVEDLVRRIYLAEYKRRQSPIAIRVTLKAFSKGRVVPIVQKWR
jgi:NAD+ synthase (glutamine-hydrolysing)